mmetsp:Transcript_27390/g.63939  ORF Transcript_27390/g.63939 Transcript_27390/m.63939 type:complete len:587 (+) Transcript_27390:85-1845(+)
MGAKPSGHEATTPRRFCEANEGPTRGAKSPLRKQSSAILRAGRSALKRQGSSKLRAGREVLATKLAAVTAAIQNGDARLIQQLLCEVLERGRQTSSDELTEVMHELGLTLKLPSPWPLHRVLVEGAEFALWQAKTVNVLNVFHVDVQQDIGYVSPTASPQTKRRTPMQAWQQYNRPATKNLIQSLRWANERAHVEEAEVCRSGLKALLDVLSLPKTWSLAMFLEAGEEVIQWRCCANDALNLNSRKHLERALLWSLNCSHVRALPEYEALIADAASRELILPADLVRILQSRTAASRAWPSSTPSFVWDDPRGPNLVARSALSRQANASAYQRMQDLIWDSCREAAVQDRKDGAPIFNFRVCKIELIKNQRNALDYAEAKKMLERAMPSSADTTSKVEFRASTGASAASMLADDALGEEPLASELTECLLWHGTSAEAANRIANTNFNFDVVQRKHGSNFGEGIYFADVFSRSDNYANEVDHATQCHAILLCRCLLGHPYHATTPAAPNKGGRPEAMARQQRLSIHKSVLQGKYNSIVAEPRRSCAREIVIPDVSQIRPVCIVWYTRQSMSSPRPSPRPSLRSQYQ